MAAKKRKPIDTTRYSGRFAERLRELREKRNFTVEDAVEAINQAGFEIAMSSYYGWENARTSPPLDAIPYIAKAFKVKKARNIYPEE